MDRYTDYIYGYFTRNNTTTVDFGLLFPDEIKMQSNRKRKKYSLGKVRTKSKRSGQPAETYQPNLQQTNILTKGK